MGKRKKKIDTEYSIDLLECPDKRGIYETFIKLNTCGKPMDQKYINNVQNLLNELDDGQ